MIISVTGGGSIEAIIPEEVYQGSNKASTIYLVAPFSKDVTVNISFQLPTAPDGFVTGPYLMESCASLNETLNTWKLELESPITQYYGIVGYAFYAINSQGLVVATGRGQFKVNRGVDFQLPEQPDEQTYELILQSLSDIKADIVNGWTQSRGIYPYNADFEYNLGATIYDNDAIYTSLVNNNKGNSLSDTTKWRKSLISTLQDIVAFISSHNTNESSHPFLVDKINGIIDGTIPMNGTINNAVNVSEKINNVPISEIFEADGKTSKKATSDGDGNNIKETYQTKSNLVTQWQATSDNNHYPSELLVKNYVDNKISSVYRYRGSVATYDDLPTENLTVGDVYNVESDGANYAWDGEKWDMLGATIDLSLFEEKANKVTSISSASTDTEYPSAKSVYSFVKDNSPDLQNSSFKSFNIELMDAWVPNANSAIGIGLGLNSDNDSEDQSNLVVTENFVRINSEDSQINYDSMLEVKPKNINIYANDRSSSATTTQVSAFFGYSNSDNKASIGFTVNDHSNPVWFVLKDGTAYLKDKEIATEEDIENLQDQIGDISTILSSVVTVSEV